MSKPFSINNLPYTLPSNTQEQLRVLAQLVEVPISFVENGGSNEVEALCGAILYRHLDRLQRVEAMTLIRNLNNKALMGKLVNIAVYPTFVNKEWGIWSFTKEELLSDQNFHSEMDTIASYIGIGISLSSGKEFISTAWKQRKLSKGGAVTVIIWGAVLFNKSELSKVNEEISRRSSIKSITLQ